MIGQPAHHIRPAFRRAPPSPPYDDLAQASADPELRRPGRSGGAVGVGDSL